MDFITSESGTVTRRAGFSFGGLVMALLVVAVLAALPSYANNCVPYQQCYGLFCGSCAYTGPCDNYGGCFPHPYRQWYWCNDPTYGCYQPGAYLCLDTCP